VPQLQRSEGRPMRTRALPKLKAAPLPDWRGSTVTTGGPISGMVLGEVVDGIATVFDPDTGRAHRVGVESLHRPGYREEER
jgi:hypothetical protein